MGKCELCGKDISSTEGCCVSKLYIGGRIYNRIPMGELGDLHQCVSDDGKCVDCGVAVGLYHHWNCDLERCPACGKQLCICDCEIYAME